MKIFIAGGSGAIGRSLVPMLVREGHEVVAMTRSEERRHALDAIGAKSVIGDVFDPARLMRVVQEAEPEMVIHQLTAFGARDSDPLAETIRVRTEGTRNLVAAAESAKARRIITQSISFVCSPLGDGLTTEDTPLYLDGPGTIRALAQSVAELEQRTLEAKGMEGIVLRYGWFYGPGTNYDPADSIPRAIRKGKMAIVGDGLGAYSFIHVDDAAAATLLALTRGGPGIYNIVDDCPVPLREWLPIAAALLNAPAPGTMEINAARDLMGDLMVYIFNEQRGASNAKAKQVLAWQPRLASWREGFRQIYASI